MGFFDQVSTAKEYPVAVLLPGYQVRCMLHVFGIVQTFINDEQKGIFSLTNATLHGLEQGNPATSMQVPELYVRKDRCHALLFETQMSRDETGLMPRTETLAVYTSHFAIQGQFHMGADSLIGDFIDNTKAMFVGVTDATVFPLFQSQAAIVQQAPLVFIYSKAVWMHHQL